jgi:hypothetical protein
MTETITAPEVPPAGYTDGRYPEPHRMGQFNRLQVAGFEVRAEDQLATRTYFGLRHTDTWFDAFLVGESGTFYVVSHDVWSEPGGAMAAAGLIGGFRSSPEGMVADERSGQWAGAITQTLTADDQLVYAAQGPASPERVTFGASSLAWRADNGDIDIAGPLAGGGTQWHHAWRQPDGQTGEMFYNHQGYSVEGAYFGEAVSGHVIVETMWGNEHYMETWWVQNRIGHWSSFANDYDDGTSEYGQILCGEFGARGAIVVDNEGREVVCTTNVNTFEEADGRVRYEFGNGETWEFWVDPARAMSFPRTKLGFGGCQRVGESRTILKASGSYLTADRLPSPQPFQ